MTEEKMQKYYRAITNMWKTLKMLLVNYEPTEEYLATAAEWLLSKGGADSFQDRLGWAALSELYREYYKDDPELDLMLLLRQVDRVERKHGVKVSIRMSLSNGTTGELEAANAQ